jgi:hypothetical protein
MALSPLVSFRKLGYWVAAWVANGLLMGSIHTDCATARQSFASSLPPTLSLTLLNLAVWLASTLHLLCIYLVFDLAFREKAPFWPFLADLPGFHPRMQGQQQS